ncbi:Dolichyldiphosphatase 1 [Tyrophagus putrescentiae]|nr:Dolichyldiphosphatase 1 [Tyrophagus putrescentiae]
MFSSYPMAASEGVEWKTWSLTQVYYPKGDRFGKPLAIFTLLPHCLMVAFFTLSLFVRDIHVILFFAGQIANELFNTALKKYVKEGRPQQIAGQPNANDSFGWPSSHCQFQAFFYVYSMLLIWRRLLVTRRRPALYYYLLMVINTVSLLFIVHSRIYLRFHYVHQCLHGLAIGSVCALAYYLLVVVLLEPYLMEPLMKSKLNSVLGLCNIYCPCDERQQQKHSSSSPRSAGKKSKSK